MNSSRYNNKVTILTPENIELELTRATAIARVTAATIDLLIMIVAMYIIDAVLNGVLQGILLNSMDEYDAISISAAIITVVDFVLFWGYGTICEIITSGQIPGKKIMNIRVIRANGGKVGAVNVVIRNLIKVVIDNWAVGTLTMLFRADGKRLGDILGGTMVIVEEVEDIPIPIEEIYPYMTAEIKEVLKPDEVAVLREYLQRRYNISGIDKVREKAKEYFDARLQKAGVEDRRAFIDNL